MNLGRVTKTVSVDREEIIKDCALGIFLFYVFIMLVTFLILFWKLLYCTKWKGNLTIIQITKDSLSNNYIRKVHEFFSII